MSMSKIAFENSVHAYVHAHTDNDIFKHYVLESIYARHSAQELTFISWLVYTVQQGAYAGPKAALNFRNLMSHGFPQTPSIEVSALWYAYSV